MKKHFVIASLFLGLTASAAKFEGSIPEWKENKENFPRAQETFQKALRILKETYADKDVTEEQLYRAALEGMLAALNTEKKNWNVLLSPRDAQNMEVDISGELVGIGTTLDFDAETQNARIRSVIPQSAAEKSGIKKNDIILSVGGKRYKTLPDMVAEIRGKKGESVRLKVLRGDRILDFKIVREKIQIPFLVSGMVNETVGYLSIQQFAENSAELVDKNLKLFDDPKIKKLIIDLRSAPGGVFHQAVKVSSLFLGEGKVIVTTKSRGEDIKLHKGHGAAWRPDVKLVVLVNEETSSGAEILAQALRVHRKAILVGAKTAGKNTVENIEKLPNGYSMKYSYLTLLDASGKIFDGGGLKPDYETTEVKRDYFPHEYAQDLKLRLQQDSSLRLATELP